MNIFPHEFKFKSIYGNACFPGGWIIELDNNDFPPNREVIKIYIDKPPEITVPGSYLGDWGGVHKVYIHYNKNENINVRRYFLKDGTLDEQEFSPGSRPENSENYLNLIRPPEEFKADVLDKNFLRDRHLLSQVRKNDENNQVIVLGNQEKTMTFEIPTKEEIVKCFSSADQLCMLIITHKEFIIIDNPL